jgi:hypothetical protein
MPTPASRPGVLSWYWRQIARGSLKSPFLKAGDQSSTPVRHPILFLSQLIDDVLADERALGLTSVA